MPDDPSVGCSEWCGLPAVPQRMGCGVFVYVHIPKTGGTTVAQHLKTHAAAHGWEYVVESAPTSKGEDPLLDHRANWSTIQSAVRRAARPRLLVFVHMSSTLAVGRSALLRQPAPPMSCALRAKGCRLVRATTLRDGLARAASAAHFRGVAHANYTSWIAAHGTNGMLRWLLYGNTPTAIRQPSSKRFTWRRPLATRARVACIPTIASSSSSALQQR